MSWKLTSNEEVRKAIRDICARCHDDEQGRTRIKGELGYDGCPAISSMSTTCGPMKMTMFSVMVFGPSGNIIIV